MGHKGNFSDNFFSVEVKNEGSNFQGVLKLLADRMPMACFVYNSVKMAPRFPNHTRVYFMNPDGSSKIATSTWIIVSHYCEDHGQNILISSAIRTSPFSSEETTNLIDIFSNSNIINWNEAHWIVSLDNYVARIMTQISIEVKGHSIEIHPNNLSCMDGTNPIIIQDFKDMDSVIDIRRLDPESGTNFIASTWKYAKPNTALPVRRFLENNESAGVYVKNGRNNGLSPVTGVLNNGYGLMSMLYTTEKARGKGYAKLAVKFAASEMLKNCLIPASSVDIWNVASLKFHHDLGDLGLKSVGRIQWIMYTPTHAC